MTTKQEETSKKTIDRLMTIDDILNMFPGKAQRLSYEINRAGLHCVGCHAATWETLEGGTRKHGINEEKLLELIDRLNKLLDEPEDEASVTLTPRAAKKYLEILEEDGKQGWGLRFDEIKAGCSGFEYQLDYSEKALEDDEIFESHGVQIHLKKGKVSRLVGSTIDYVDGLNGTGFKVSNPNVKKSCGCGTSHGY